jgi:hypothetical protein
MDALQPHATPHVKPTNATAQPPNNRPRSGIPRSSTRSVSARMNTSHTMCPDAAGCRSCSRSPASGRTLDHRLEAPAHHFLNSIRCWITDEPRPPPNNVCSTRQNPPRSRHVTTSPRRRTSCGRPAAVELLQQTDQPVRDRRQHITARRRRAPDVARAHSRTECARDLKTTRSETSARTRTVRTTSHVGSSPFASRTNRAR